MVIAGKEVYPLPPLVRVNDATEAVAAPAAQGPAISVLLTFKIAGVASG